MMRLGALVDGLSIGTPSESAGWQDVEVSGASHDSRRVRPGDLYVAIVGARHDGRRYASDAVDRGATAVLGPAGAPDGLGVPYLETDDPRRIVARLAGRIYDHPDRALTMVGVTGTNGKSTVVNLVGTVLEAAGRPTGVLGTLGYQFAQHRYDDAFRDGRTTPEATDLFRTLAAMRAAGARAVAMETSSHALDQGRVADVSFDVGVFTNLTRDHLDFHGDMEGYFDAKRRLFAPLGPSAAAVVYTGDAYGERLAAEIGARSPDRRPRLLTYCATADRTAAVTIRDAALGFEGIRATVRTPRGDLDIRTGLLGRYNLENMLATIAVAEALDVSHDAVAEAFGRQRPVNGRLEPVDAGQAFPALVDYAHTPAALESALSSLRELVTPRGLRTVVVFGCGGEKDTGKRAQMGALAGRGADLALATSDNPRGEDPLAILAQVEEGLRESGGHYRLQPDRREAIREAVRLARDEGDWAVLVAGKGHEAEQVIGGRVLPFDDHDELAQAVRDLTVEASHGRA